MEGRPLTDPPVGSTDRLASGFEKDRQRPLVHEALGLTGQFTRLGVFDAATLTLSLDAHLHRTGAKPAVVSGEGGHSTLPATNDEEQRVIDLVRKQEGHCSAESFLCGPGLVRLYVALAELAGRGRPTVTPTLR